MSRCRIHSSVNEHPDRDSIIAALRANIPLRKIEQEHDISRSVLQRYKVAMGTQVAPAAPTSPQASPLVSPRPASAPASPAPAVDPGDEILQALAREDAEGIPFDRIKIIRAMLLTSMNRFTQAEIGRRLGGVSERTVRNWLEKGRKLGLKLATNLKPDEALFRVMFRYEEAAARANTHYYQAVEAGDNDAMHKWNEQIIRIGREEIAAYRAAGVFERGVIEGSSGGSDPRYGDDHYNDPHIDPELRRWYTYSPHTGKYYTTTEAHILLAESTKVLMHQCLAEGTKAKAEGSSFMGAVDRVLKEHEAAVDGAPVAHALEIVSAVNRAAAQIRAEQEGTCPMPSKADEEALF